MDAWLKRYPRRREIVRLFEDLSVTIRWFSEETKVNPNFYQLSNTSGVWIVPLIQRCLELIPTELDEIAEPGFEVQEVLRHALILFVQPIRRRFGIVTGSSHLRIQKLRGVLSQHLFEWGSFDTLLRWTLVSGGVEANTLEDQLWFAGVLATHPQFEGERCKDSTLKALRSFIWMDDVFEERVNRLTSQIVAVRAEALVLPMLRSDLLSPYRDNQLVS